MELNINNCSTCPFRVSDYDDYSTGHDTIDYCNLSRYLKLEDYIIDVYNQHDNQIYDYCDYCLDYSENCDDMKTEWDETKCTCKDINNDKVEILPEWCPLKKEELKIKIK